jgi:signal transduction histidine kinase
VLGKIVEGLVRNAIENTPAGGRIDVSVRTGESGPEFKVKDNGVGITEDNQRLILDNYFTAYEPTQYSSGRPYDFNAGGKGMDLLRMRIFSELYHFKIHVISRRCCYIRQNTDVCPGNPEECDRCKKSEKYQDDRGTSVTIQFYAVQRRVEREAWDSLNYDT